MEEHSVCGSIDCVAREFTKTLIEERNNTDQKFERVFTAFQTSQHEQTVMLKELLASHKQGLDRHMEELKEEMGELKSSVHELGRDVDAMSDKVRVTESSKIDRWLKSDSGLLDVEDVLKFSAAMQQHLKRGFSYVMGLSAIAIMMFLVVMALAHGEQTREVLMKLFR